MIRFLHPAVRRDGLKNEAQRIVVEIEQVIGGDAWHGPSLNELLEGVGARDAAQRPIPSAHNIWELVLHITSWANISRRRLTGGQVEPSEGEDWPVVESTSDIAWAAAQTELIDSHRSLCDEILKLSDEQLSVKVPQGDRTVSNALHGIAQHAAYHGGQIALLKKAVTTHQRRDAT